MTKRELNPATRKRGEVPAQATVRLTALPSLPYIRATLAWLDRRFKRL